jgi:hypothetical protein
MKCSLVVYEMQPIVFVEMDVIAANETNPKVANER